MKEDLCHPARQADAAMRGGVTGQVSRMHPYRSVYSHEVVHVRTNKPRSRRPAIFPNIHFRLHHHPISTDVVSIQRRLMMQILLRDPEVSRRCPMPFPASRNRRHPYKLVALVVTQLLPSQVNVDAPRTRDTLPFPIGRVRH